jgi:muconate cycloisomerase
VETPVAGRDAREIAIVRQQVDVPLIEHVFTAEDALQYLKHESLDCFNIATTGSGGIWPARIIAEMARVGGVGILLGSTVEMGPGTLAQLHLAASIPNLTLPSDLVGPALYAADVLTEPLHYDNSYMAVPSAAGLGGTVDREKLRAL